jgi:2,3,4,5-tetrahydropyridine-2-carboxylate N-succinyltransferase
MGEKAVVMYFPIQKMETWEAGSLTMTKCSKERLRRKGVCSSRCISALRIFISSGIMMPSYVNIGAYVDAGTMVDRQQ